MREFLDEEKPQEPLKGKWMAQMAPREVRRNHGQPVEALYGACIMREISWAARRQRSAVSREIPEMQCLVDLKNETQAKRLETSVRNSILRKGLLGCQALPLVPGKLRNSVRHNPG